MAASVFDSPHFARLFPTGEAGRLFTDTAEVRAMLLVEGALAKVQGDMGLIPKESAYFIHRSAMEVQVDPSACRRTGHHGVLCARPRIAFAAMKPEHASISISAQPLRT